MRLLWPARKRWVKLWPEPFKGIGEDWFDGGIVDASALGMQNRFTEAGAVLSGRGRIGRVFSRLNDPALFFDRLGDAVRSFSYLV